MSSVVAKSGSSFEISILAISLSSSDGFSKNDTYCISTCGATS